MKTTLAAIALISGFSFCSTIAADTKISAAVADIEKIEMRSGSITLVDQTTVFKGAVIATMGEMKISGEQMIYDPRSGMLNCIGEAKIERLGSVIIGTDLAINLKEKMLSIRQARITVLQK